MANKTALMEWLDQTKRLSKEEDYMGLAIIDDVVSNIHVVCPELIRRHRKFFNTLCDYYHKDPNPVELLGGRKLTQHFKNMHEGKTSHAWQASFCQNPKKYPRGGCRTFKMMRKAITDQLDIQIERFKKAQQVITWQWFEVIDFMFERPELVNPVLIDDYTRNKINEVCSDGKKKNPLDNGISTKFGKYWKDAKGKWHAERRKRF